jgi:hypothetical protein
MPPATIKDLNMLKIAYDCELKRPGCVILQAAMGGSSVAARMFPAESWLVSPTDNLHVYPVTRGQLKALVKMTTAALSESSIKK